jgi:hypothetical protein
MQWVAMKFWHLGAAKNRRVAAALESRDPAAADQNAALIAEHLEAAGEPHAAYGWHMLAAAWATNCDIAAARLSWEGTVTLVSVGDLGGFVG